MKFLLFSIIFLICYISNILAEPILVKSKYCTQYNNTNIYLDSEKLKALDDNQYILKDFKKLDNDIKLDYYIRYAHISSGICYPKKVIQTDEIGNFTINDEVKNLRYFKTVVCYYLYDQYFDESANQSREILNRPCNSKISEFYNNYHAFLHDETNCPPPSDKSMISVGDKNAVSNARFNFLYGIYNLYQTTTEDDMCKSMNIQKELNKYKNNDEIYYCGFSSLQMKTNYCNKIRFKKLDQCCVYDITGIDDRNSRTYEIYTTPLLFGIGSLIICLAIGMPLSYMYIKDIRTQEEIMKAVAEQEKMYQLQSKRQQAENPSIYSGYSTDPYRPHSNYSSISHQQIVPPSPQHSLPIAGNMSVHSYNNSQNRIIRSPQPLPASPADISNLNNPPSIQFAEISLPGPATPSLSNTPRISSICSSSNHSSSNHSSIDISDNINLPPLDIPSSPVISISPSDSYVPVPERTESSLHKHDRPSSYRDDSYDYSYSSNNSLTVPKRDESAKIKHERPKYEKNKSDTLTVPRRDESSKVKHDIVYHKSNEAPSVPSRDESAKVKHERRPNSIKSSSSIGSVNKDEGKTTTTTASTTKDETKEEAKTTTDSTTKDETKEEVKTTTASTTKDETKEEVKTTTTSTTKDESKEEAKSTTKEETTTTNNSEKTSANNDNTNKANE